MEHISFQTSWVLVWLFDSTICISILICLILAIKAVTKGKLPAWWSYGLWLLLLLRMLMPWGIESRMSIFNYLPVPLENESYMPFLLEHDLSIPLIQDNFDTAKTTPAPTLTDAGLGKESPHRYYDDYNSKESGRFHFNLSLDNALLIVWFTGVMLFGVRILFKNFMFWLTIRRVPSVKDKIFLDLFEKCRLSLAIRKNIAVIVTDKVKSPALFGFLRPRLLLPPHFLDTLQKDELRYVFLHELSHLKRHDIVVSWLVTVLQIVHWFNPFVWYAFHHLRVDQEAACDAYVLSRIKQIQPADYANTIVRLLERFIQNRQLPSLVGIIENKSQIRRRIAMIMNFKRYALQTKCALILMLIIVGLIFLTGSSGKAGAHKTEIGGNLKETQVVRPIDGLVSNRHDNKVSPSEDEKDLHEEIVIAPSNEMVETIGMKEDAEINLAKVDTKSVKTLLDPSILASNKKQETLSETKIPEIEEPVEDAKAAIQNEDFKKACELLQPLAEENNAEAQFLLGSLYIKGQGVEKDDTKGLSWIMKAARQGYTEARSRALTICLDLANQGDATAMYNVGYMCLQGWGGEQDTDVCIGWLETAAKSGHVRSAKVLSEIYAKGEFGITPDEEKASYWRNLPADFAADIDGIWSEEAPDKDDPLTEPTFDTDAQEYILEDTLVIGSLLSMKFEWYRAEDLKFEIFNALNSVDEFDITCEMRPRSGPGIKRRFCDVGYMKKAREIALRGIWFGGSFMGGWGGYVPSDAQLAIENAHKTRALNKEMVELAGKHPSLAKAMINEYELKQRYIVERRERFKDSILIGRTKPEEYFGDDLKFLDVAYVAHNDRMMGEQVWNYWDRWFRSVIHQEPYRSVWLSSNTETYTDEFVAYVNRILSGG